MFSPSRLPTGRPGAILCEAATARRGMSSPTTTPTTTAYLSVETTFLLVLGMAAAALLSSVVSVGVGDAEASRQLALIGQPALELVAALFAARAAARIPPSARPAAIMLTLGIVFTALGDGAWAFSEVVLGKEMNYPGFSEVLFGASYVCFASCVAFGTARFLKNEDLPLAYGASLVGGAVVLSLGWYFIARPALQAAGGLTPATLTDLAYITADVLLLLVPGTAILMIMARSDDKRDGLPVLLFAIGLVGMAVGDIGWFVQQSYGGWRPGSIVDFAWIAAMFFMASAIAAGADVSGKRGSVQAA